MRGLKLTHILNLSAATAAIAACSPAWAQDAGASSGGDIIVTARRVEERLQDVPISISVLRQEELTRRNISVASDLATYTPSLVTNTRFGPEKSSFSIRGFSQDLSTAATVGVYFSEVVGVRAQGGTTSGNTVPAGSFTDLENVQVLKGPQGTLFGRNTTGGAIMLTPKRPTDKFEGYVEASYGNFDQFRLNGAINVPLNEVFKLRIAGERNSREGIMKNRSGRGPDDYNDVNYWYVRGTLLAELSPDIKNTTLFHYGKSDTRGYATRMIGCARPDSSVNPLNITQGTPGYSGLRHLQALSCEAQVARQQARGDSLYDVETRNLSPFLSLENWQVINTTEWKASDSITIKNIFSYGQIRERANFDLSSSNFVVPNLDPSSIPGVFPAGFNLTRISPFLNVTGQVNAQFQPLGPGLMAGAGTPYDRIVLDTAGPDTLSSGQSTITEELQLQFLSPDGRFQGVIGGYLEFSRPLGFSQQRTSIFLDCVRPELLQCTNPLFIGSISESNWRFNFENHGVFAQGSYKLTDNLTATAGFRYTFDKISAVVESTSASFDPTNRSGRAFIDPLSGVRITRTCQDSFRHATATPGIDRSPCNTQLVNKSSEPTWLLGLDYKISPDAMVYAKYSRGYRQGGINAGNFGIESWQPEKLDSYEIGAKTSFRGAIQGYLNVAAFYNKLKNMQVFAGLTPKPEFTGLGGGAAIINAASSRSYGFEVDAFARLTDNLDINLGYTYLDTKIEDVLTKAQLLPLIAPTPWGDINPRVQPGSAFLDSPKHKMTGTVTYTLPLDEKLGKISVGATVVITSKTVNDGAVPAVVNGINLGVTPSSTLLNLNFDWKSVGGSPIDLAFYATNVTNKAFTIANTGGWNSFGTAEILLNQPRMFGVRVKVNFGQ